MLVHHSWQCHVISNEVLRELEYVPMRFCENCMATEGELQLVPAVEAKPPPPPFTSEPTTHEALLDKYIVENKVPARNPNTTMLLCMAKSRAGENTEVVEGQRYKLFLALCLQTHLTLKLLSPTAIRPFSTCCILRPSTGILRSHTRRWS